MSVTKWTDSTVKVVQKVKYYALFSFALINYIKILKIQRKIVDRYLRIIEGDETFRTLEIKIR